VFVGNLSFEVSRDELIEAFSAAGKVLDAKVPTDRETGRPRGFAFVEFENEESAQKCISLLNGSSLKGRPLRVSEAEDRPPRPPGSGPRPGPRPFRPGGDQPFRGGMPMSSEPPPFSDGREGRRRKFSGGRQQTEGRPFNKEKGPRRVERRRGGRGFNEDEDY
jgi:RNA recognition motif-containing protein